MCIHVACPQSLYYIKYSALCCCCCCSYCCYSPELISALSFAFHFYSLDIFSFHCILYLLFFPNFSLNLGAFVILCCEFPTLAASTAAAVFTHNGKIMYFSSFFPYFHFSLISFSWQFNDIITMHTREYFIY